jgi:hypothetical protein
LAGDPPLPLSPPATSTLISIEGSSKLVGDVLVEGDKPDLRDQARATIEPVSSCIHDHLTGFGPRVSEYAGGNGRKRNRPAPADGGCVQGCRHRFLQQTLIVLPLPVPRTDNVDHIPGRELSCRGDGGPTRADRSVLGDPIVRLLLDDRAARLHDRRGHTTTVLKVFVGCVDDRRYRLGRQIPLDDFDHRENSTDRRGSLCSGMQRGVLVLALAAVLLPAAPSMAAAPEEGIDLGGVFGHAVASAISLTSDTIQLDLQVEADDDAAVVAHLIEAGGTQETIPLASRGAGTFGITTEVRKTDYLVVFEAIEGSLASQSQPFRLTDLGVDPALVGILTVPPTDDEEFSDSTRQWGWAGLGLAAAALTLVALWALPDRRRRAQAAEESEREAREANEGLTPAEPKVSDPITNAHPDDD